MLRQAGSLILPVLLASLIAANGQGIVDMMVDLNMVYIAAIGPILILELSHCAVPSTTADRSMAVGCGVALACYLARWSHAVQIPEAVPLMTSMFVTLIVALRAKLFTFLKEFRPCTNHLREVPSHQDS
jgi:SSS family solute:Na+ symporter